ncbi:MAG: hypothetical protein WC227_02665 [Patescibacteria group bacterium]|jgi:hypothetical protein
MNIDSKIVRTIREETGYFRTTLIGLPYEDLPEPAQGLLHAVDDLLNKACSLGLTNSFGGLAPGETEIAMRCITQAVVEEISQLMAEYGSMMSRGAYASLVQIVGRLNGVSQVEGPLRLNERHPYKPIPYDCLLDEEASYLVGMQLVGMGNLMKRVHNQLCVRRPAHLSQADAEGVYLRFQLIIKSVMGDMAHRMTDDVFSDTYYDLGEKITRVVKLFDKLILTRT